MFHRKAGDRSGFRWAIWLPLLVTIMLAGNSGISQAGPALSVQRINKAAVVAPAQTESVTPLADIVQVVAGQNHTCALTTTGGVKCWGKNTSGQLGTGDTIDQATPANVVGLDSGVSAIAADDVNTCALVSTGAVKCWGGNWNGQLGDGTTEQRLMPVDVVGLNEVSAIAAGPSHTCALTSAGTVKCWGDNLFGQLGDGTTKQRLIPVDVVGLNGVSAIVAGSTHTCALTSAGTVKCWGQGAFLGTGTWISSLTPVDVVGMNSGVLAIAAGAYHTCALTSAGAVKCWGSNDWGQLGDNTTLGKTTPTDVVGLGSGVAAITGGNAHTCALTTAGEVKCWGMNVFGQLGTGNTDNHATPANVVGLDSETASISAGGVSTCGRTAANGVKCWGSNRYGQLGNNTKVDSPTPVDVLMSSDWKLFLPMLVR